MKKYDDSILKILTCLNLCIELGDTVIVPGTLRQADECLARQTPSDNVQIHGGRRIYLVEKTSQFSHGFFPRFQLKARRIVAGVAGEPWSIWYWGMHLMTIKGDLVTRCIVTLAQSKGADQHVNIHVWSEGTGTLAQQGCVQLLEQVIGLIRSELPAGTVTATGVLR